MNADQGFIRVIRGLFSADVSIIFDPEAPGFCDPLLRVVDADAWTSSDASRRDCLELFKPDAIAEKIGAIECAIDAHRDAEFAWTTREIVIGMGAAPLAHELDAFDRLERAHEDRVRNVRQIADDVELVIHAVNEVDVSDAAAAVHRFGAFRAAPAESV